MMAGQTVTEKCHLESAQSYSLLDNIQTYTKACLSYRGISCGVCVPVPLVYCFVVLLFPCRVSSALICMWVIT